jgi:protein TonB
MARLAQVKRYPASARARRETGTAYVRFTLSRSGRPSAISLDRSSGVAALDREALDTVRRATPLPTVPENLPAPLTLTVAIEFTLN